MHKDIRRIVRQIEKLGYICEQGRTHILVKSTSGGGTIASLPLSPGRGRWEPNLVAQLRKAGIFLGRRS